MDIENMEHRDSNRFWIIGVNHQNQLAETASGDALSTYKFKVGMNENLGGGQLIIYFYLSVNKEIGIKPNFTECHRSPRKFPS